MKYSYYGERHGQKILAILADIEAVTQISMAMGTTNLAEINIKVVKS